MTLELLSLGQFVEAAAALERLRSHGAVAKTTFMGKPVLLVLGHAEVKELLTSRDFTTRPPADAPGPPISAQSKTYFDSFLVRMDGPEHAQVKQILAGSLSPRLVESQAVAIRAEALALCDGLAASLTERGEFDLVSEFSFTIAIRSLCRVLGVPATMLSPWEAVVARLNSPEALKEPGIYSAAFDDMVSLTQRILADGHVDDGLIRRLLISHDDGRLSTNVLVALVLTLVFAGHETTSRLIACLVERAFRNSGDLEEIVATSAAGTAAFDELTRWVTPIELGNMRWAVKDTELGGWPIPAGTALSPALLAANFDKRAQECPHAVRLDRSARSLSFGYGRHYCPGAGLGNLTARIAVSTFLERWTPRTIRLREEGETRRIFGVGIRELWFTRSGRPD